MVVRIAAVPFESPLVLSHRTECWPRAHRWSAKSVNLDEKEGIGKPAVEYKATRYSRKLKNLQKERRAILGHRGRSGRATKGEKRFCGKGEPGTGVKKGLSINYYHPDLRSRDKRTRSRIQFSGWLRPRSHHVESVYHGISGYYYY